MRQSITISAALSAVALAVVAVGGPVAAAPSRVSLAAVAAGYTRPVLVTHAPGSPGIVFVLEQSRRPVMSRHTVRVQAKRRT